MRFFKVFDIIGENAGIYNGENMLVLIFFCAGFIFYAEDIFKGLVLHILIFASFFVVFYNLNLNYNLSLILLFFFLILLTLALIFFRDKDNTSVFS